MSKVRGLSTMDLELATSDSLIDSYQCINTRDDRVRIDLILVDKLDVET